MHAVISGVLDRSLVSLIRMFFLSRRHEGRMKDTVVRALGRRRAMRHTEGKLLFCLSSNHFHPIT